MQSPVRFSDRIVIVLLFPRSIHYPEWMRIDTTRAVLIGHQTVLILAVPFFSDLVDLLRFPNRDPIIFAPSGSVGSDSDGRTTYYSTNPIFFRSCAPSQTSRTVLFYKHVLSRLVANNELSFSIFRSAPTSVLSLPSATTLPPSLVSCLFHAYTRRSQIQLGPGEGA